MSSSSKQPRSGQTSINYRLNPVKAPASEFADAVYEKYAHPLSNDKKQIHKKSEATPHKILSTAELVSAVDKIWDCASRLDIFHPKADGSSSHNSYNEILDNLGKEENGRTHEEYYSVDIRSVGQLPSLVNPKLEFPKAIQKLLAVESFSKKYTHSTFSRHLKGFNSLPDETCGGSGVANVGLSYELGHIYQWMREISPAVLKYAENNLEIENRTAGKHNIPVDRIGSPGRPILGDAHSPETGLAVNDIDFHLGSVKSNNLPSGCNKDLVFYAEKYGSLLSDYFLRDGYDMKMDCSISKTSYSSLCADYSISSVASSNVTYGKFQHKNRRKEPEKSAVEDESRLDFPYSEIDKHNLSFAKQEHAFAGALAGVLVSLCLHPVDTIKTVVQSCHPRDKSICYIGKSIVSERGLTGLYRGIASNIASSAPISAIYTLTYESVKGAFLPHFPKEFHSLAHCIAGGCASVATSFIFTPSERIKQQMQVGSHYNNCWNALVGILGKGGLPSLYAGWGAVLCRNVPHSIIKFYAYESLKQIMLPSLHSIGQPSTLQTLVCGGLAGSTAALFTTPFDVVKTRLQTQIPGSMSQYNNVYHALRDIGRSEGLRGLYRGLIPRLVMYMSQGAIFFTSYEFFKSIFSLEVS